MSEKSIHSTENTQYYYHNAEGQSFDLDYLEPDTTPSFWRGRRTIDGVTVSVHYHYIRTRDLRFSDDKQ